MSDSISRRSFLKAGATAAVGLAVAPTVLSGKEKKNKKTAPKPLDRKLKILAVGIGGRGSADLAEMETEEIIGLCDVDWAYAKPIFDKYPNAKRYKDYRVMFDEMLDQADAVLVATADHTHAVIAAAALKAGKHVYCEKPLTLTVYESRLLTKLAAKAGVATQMGNQGASGEGVRKVCEWIWNGEIGEVTKVEAFTDRPIWPQGLNRPEKADPIPDTLDWENFVGPAPMRPYNSIYTPWNFRGWWDFGTGSLGDMACHILHPAFKALKLGSPIHVQGSSTLLLNDCCPHAQIVRYTFPARDNMAKVGMPEVEIVWHDGDLKPAMPKGWPAGKSLNDSGGCLIFHGTKDTLICGCYGVNPWLLSGRTPNAPKVCREITVSHQQDWIRACKEDPSVRVKSASDFSEAGPFNEMVAMGVLAVRLQGLNQILDWDGQKMEFTNIPQGAKLRMCIKDGFEIHEGHPTFDKTWTEEFDAGEFAKNLIKKPYREGWSLPEMPED